MCKYNFDIFFSLQNNSGLFKLSAIEGNSASGDGEVIVLCADDNLLELEDTYNGSSWTWSGPEVTELSGRRKAATGVFLG